MTRTVGDALNDPTTALAKAAAQTAAERAARLVKAREIADREGITLEDALASMWALSDLWSR